MGEDQSTRGCPQFRALHPTTMFQLRTAAELIHRWNDDDVYLPRIALDHIGENAAWGPTSSWASERNVKFLRVVNVRLRKDQKP